jgi:hypothetical protein
MKICPIGPGGGSGCSSWEHCQISFSILEIIFQIFLPRLIREGGCWEIDGGGTVCSFVSVSQSFVFYYKYLQKIDDKFKGYLCCRLGSLKGNSSDINLTYVSIHIRRTDYENHLKYFGKTDPVSITYFYDAMKYFRDNYKVSPSKDTR